MKKSILLTLTAVFGIMFTLGEFSWVCAQQEATEEFTLEEITITAQKREENQQKAPIAIDVISGDAIKELGFNNFDQILSNLSGVYINTNQDGMRVSIRGMNDNTATVGTMGLIDNYSPMVAVNTDGVYSANRGGYGLYDVERMEVLYGPQSTLYSSNSPGGIVNILTTDPKLDQYDLSGSFKFGNYHNVQTEGMLNAPFSDSIAFRLAFSTSNRDGYLKSGADDDNRQSGRLKVLFKPNDKFSFISTLEYTRSSGINYNGVPKFVTQDDLADPWDDTGRQSQMVNRPRDSYSPKIYGRMDWDLDFGTLTFIPMYAPQKSIGDYTDEYYGYDVTEELTTTKREKGAELRVVSSSDFSFKWILGANIYDSYQYQDYYRTFTDLDFTVKMNRGYTEKTKAVYGNVNYPVTDRFRLTGGLRWSSDEGTAIQWAQEVRGTGNTITEIVLAENTNTSKYDKPDYKVGAEYDIGTNSMLYANVSSSYRTVAVPLKGKTLDPEEMTAFEIGAKNRFFGNKFQVNAYGFYYDYANYVASAGMITDPLTLSPDSGSSTNAKLRKYGASLETSAILGNNDKLDFSVSYLNSEFTECYFDFVSTGLTDLDISGNPETYSSKLTVSAAYNKNFNLTNGAILTARLDSRYQTGFYIDYKNWAQDKTSPYSSEWFIYDLGEGVNYQDAYHLTNFALIYANPDGKWTVTGYVNNIENYAVKKSIRMDTIMIGPPRTFGAVISFTY